MNSPTSLSRAPFISIESIRPHINRYITSQLSRKLTSDSRINFSFEESISNIGLILNDSARGTFELPDIIVYQLRNANLWENQTEIKKLLSEQTTVIVTEYVLTNRANLLSKGIVSPEFCFQWDEKLLKPDLQIYLQSRPIPLNIKPSFSAADTFDSRKRLVNSFDALVAKDEEIKIVNSDMTNDFLAHQLTESVVKLYSELKISDLKEFKYFDGYS